MRRCDDAHIDGTKAAPAATDMANVTGPVPCLTMTLKIIRPAYPTTLLVFSTLFDNYGVAHHRAHAYEPESYLELPDLYAICVIDELQRPERMVGGMLVKTNIGYDEPGFLPGLLSIISLVPELRSVSHEHCSLLPAPIDADNPAPLTEDQSLHVFRQLWSEHQSKQLLQALPKLHAG